MRILRIPRGNFNAVAYTADGRHLVSLNSGTVVRIWSTADLSERLSFRLPGALYSHTHLGLAGPLAVFTYGVYSFQPAWDYLEGPGGPRPKVPLRTVEMENTAPYARYVLAADRQHVLGMQAVYHGSQGYKLMTWDLDGKLRQTLTIPVTHSFPVPGPDGRTLALFQNADVLLFDLQTQTEFARLRHTDEPSRAVFSRDGRTLITAAGRSLWRWEVESRTGERLPAFASFIDGLALHPDGHLFAAGDGGGEIRLWETASGRQVASLNFEVGAVHGLAFSPDGMTVAGAGHKNALVVWDLE